MRVAEILGAFPGLSALVVGDIVLDRWCFYDPAAAEPSRETGIPRVAVVAAETTPGAGGTVANNLKALGIGQVEVLGVVGDDGSGFELEQALASRGIGAGMLVTQPDFQTFTYTKLLNLETGAEDRPRVDFINTVPPSHKAQDQVVRRFWSEVRRFDAILVADQAETEAGGVVTPALRQALAEAALEYPRKIFWVDSRRRIEHFRNAIVKPNQDEARAACLRTFDRVSYQELRRLVGHPFLFVTRGAEGVLLVEEGGEALIPTRPVADPVDICGAGDSFSAGAACALAVGAPPAVAARFGNLVTSITIMKKGTGTASPEEVLEAEARRAG